MIPLSASPNSTKFGLEGSLPRPTQRIHVPRKKFISPLRLQGILLAPYYRPTFFPFIVTCRSHGSGDRCLSPTPTKGLTISSDKSEQGQECAITHPLPVNPDGSPISESQYKIYRQQGGGPGGKFKREPSFSGYPSGDDRSGGEEDMDLGNGSGMEEYDRF